MNIVFDWDGVFNNQTEYLCSVLGIPIPDRYRVLDSINLSKATAQRLQKSYGDMELHRQIPLADGVAEALHMTPTPFIYSANMGEAMIEYKREVVYRLAPHFPEDHIIMMLGLSKPKLEWADVMVEDSPENLLQYDDRTLRILLIHEYNKYALVDPRALTVVCAHSLKDAIHTIERQGKCRGGRRSAVRGAIGQHRCCQFETDVAKAGIRGPGEGSRRQTQQ